jgi:hypothetical protein
MHREGAPLKAMTTAGRPALQVWVPQAVREATSAAAVPLPIVRL